MWRAWILSACAAAVASLAAAGPASAGDPQATSPPSAVVRASDDGQTWSLLGFNVCVGGSSPARRCHITLPAPPPPPPPKRLTVMGKTLCLGGAPHHPGCDWQLPQHDAHG